MNEHLTERLARRSMPYLQAPIVERDSQRDEARLVNAGIRDYFKEQYLAIDGPVWLRQPEIPDSSELLVSPRQGKGETPSLLTCNRLQGAWGSKIEYLGDHYQLLREDAVLSLREAVSSIRSSPDASENVFQNAIGIYQNVKILGITTSTRGIAHRITFSTKRAGVQILWNQSKRLIAGTLVVLSPKSDSFQKTAIVATVAARPTQGLEQNPPELDIFFANCQEMEIDPSMEYIMIESRSSYYEAAKHSLLALQRMASETFPLQEYFVQLEQDIQMPKYLKKKPDIDVSSVFINMNVKIDASKTWPQLQHTAMDATQVEALERMLTKRLAIIQGPPGTGKTYVTVQALLILLANQAIDDPPIIITCHTNHALDQLLRLIAYYEPRFVRLGGRSKDIDIIKKRTLYELRNEPTEARLHGCQYSRAKKEMDVISEAIGRVLAPLKIQKEPLDHKFLSKIGVLSLAQSESLEAGAKKWQSAGIAAKAATSSPFGLWMPGNLVEVPHRPQPENYDFGFEDAELDVEQLKEEDVDNIPKDEGEFDRLFGANFAVADNFTGKSTPMNQSEVQRLLDKHQDLWKIAEAFRPAIYRHLQTEMKAYIRRQFIPLAEQFNKAALKRKIGTFEKHENILRDQRIIGVTTTGLSKYRGLFSAMKCKVIVVEEAAETLEAPIIAGCIPSLEHLILVGDHKQLRPHCQSRALEDAPYYFNVSLFERLVLNRMAHTTLIQQRRMIPEVRRLLRPIYGNIIQDHESVMDKVMRPDMPGMAGINSWWFTHQWIEQRDDLMSCVNENEAMMIVGFVDHLVKNGVNSRAITILTFYNGQRKKLVKMMKDSSLQEPYPSVVTVDSFQGEENQVILLSLVRSNDNRSVGFLNVENRVCVALSRARCGFYIFGNAVLLEKNKMWKKIIKTMAGAEPKDKELLTTLREPMRFNKYLPLICNKHDRRVQIEHPKEWESVDGGCLVKCTEALACGHICPLLCHPYSHHGVQCSQCEGKSRNGQVVAKQEEVLELIDLSLTD